MMHAAARARFVEKAPAAERVRQAATRITHSSGKRQAASGKPAAGAMGRDKAGGGGRLRSATFNAASIYIDNLQPCAWHLASDASTPCKFHPTRVREWHHRPPR